MDYSEPPIKYWVLASTFLEDRKSRLFNWVEPPLTLRVRWQPVRSMSALCGIVRGGGLLVFSQGFY